MTKTKLAAEDKIDKWYCPNCGKLLCSRQSKDKVSKCTCPTCGKISKNYERSRRVHIIEVIDPIQELGYY